MIKIKQIKGASPEQNNIYKGLSSISPEAAAFYRDAVLIMGDDCLLESKSNLVAHLSREIDSTLRGIFAPKALLPPREIDPVAETQKQSITRALGFADEKIAEEWHKVASTFAKFAHRNGKEIRKIELFADGWERYEKVLVVLSGSAYALADRINHLTSYEEPTKEMLRSLKVMLRQPNFAFQFFSTLKQVKWLIQMEQQGFFGKDTFPVPPSEGDRFSQQEWLPLRYLKNLTGALSAGEIKIINTIIDRISNAVIDKTTVIDDYSIAMILQVLKLLPGQNFGEREVKLLSIYRDGKLTDHDFFEGEFMELLKNNLAEGSTGALTIMVEYAYGYRKTETYVEGFEELEMNPMLRFYPNLSTAYRQVINRMNGEVTKLSGLQLVEKLVISLETLFRERPYEALYFPSVEWTDQSDFGNSDWEYELIQYVRDSAVHLSSEDRRLLATRLVHSECPACWRLALHIINTWFADLKDLFWTWIKMVPLDGGFPVHELYLLLRDRLGDIDAHEFLLLTEWIKGVVFESGHLPAEQIELIKRERIFRYLSALSPKDPNLAKELAGLVEKYRVSNYIDPHPEFDGYSSTGEGIDIPERPADFENLDVGQQVAFLSKHPGSDRFDFMSMGLGMLMNNLIIQKPHKYVDGLGELGTLPPVYLGQVVGSFAQTIKNGSIADFWPLVKAFSRWTQPAGGGDGGEIQLESYTLGGFFYDLADQLKQFEYSGGDILELLRICVEIMETEKHSSVEQLERDLVSHTLNSGYHKLFQACIILNDLFNESQGAGDNIRVAPQFLAFIDKAISVAEPRNIDFSIALGMYFPYLLRAEGKWVKDNMDKIFAASDPVSIKYGLMGTLTSAYRLTKELIEFLRDNNLLQPALSSFKEDGPALGRLAKFALIELRSIDNTAVSNPASIIYHILQNEDPVQYAKLIRTASWSEGYPDELLLQLWGALMEKALAKPELFEKVLAEAVEFIRGLSIISQRSIELVNASLPFLGSSSNGFGLIRFLLSIPSQSLAATAELVIQVWKTTGNHPFVTKELEDMVNQLYLKGEEAIADQICIYVSDRGVMGLKEIYDQNKRGKFHKKE